jgi:uracil-DNA glycosylase
MAALDTLNHEQRMAFDFLLKGDNLALLGPAGVGKSYLLSIIDTEFPGTMRRLKIAQGDSNPRLPRIQMCALTGCAALLLGHKAKTLHSWAGIGLGKGTIQELYIKIRRNRKAMQHWLLTDLLIIDEVSMLTAELLDKLNELAKKIRGNKEPFGGLQVLLVGDFFQLPPVHRGDEPTTFAFEGQAWKEGIQTCIELTQIQRQKDPIFHKILNEARKGALTMDSCAVLRAREGLDWRKNKIKPTLLFPRRSEVDLINESNMKALKGQRQTYKARLAYDGKMPAGFTESDEGFQQSLTRFDTDAAYSVQLELVQDAQVMLIANVDPAVGLVNGSRGILVGFCGATGLPIIEFVNGVRRPMGTHAWPIEDYPFVSRTQIPLRLAWAVTTHKIQGASLDCALVDIGAGNFEYGQAYVALSRARSLEGLYVHDFDPAAFRAHPTVKTFYKELKVVKMDEKERDELLQQLQTDEKSIIDLPSQSVCGIHVIKEEPIQEPGSAGSNWLAESIPDSWKSVLETCHPTLLTLSQRLDTKPFLPTREHIWAALTLTPLENIRVVILGQDPYPTAGHAHGLAFSVLPTIRPLPGSLRNIYKELESDLGIPKAIHGHLENWAKQGVLLLNTVLTVEEGEPQSHSKIGWESVTDQIIRSIIEKTEKVVFVLWGKSAQVKRVLIDQEKHRIVESAHPSPLSASRGFYGSKPFSRINQLLGEMGKEHIVWNL